MKRKEYVKPAMEGESFVANEYVAACWVVACPDCGGKDVFMKEPSSEYDNDGFIELSQSRVWIYTGNLANYGPETHYRSDDDDKLLKEIDQIPGINVTNSYDFHTVKISSGANGGAAQLRPSHPNASA